MKLSQLSKEPKLIEISIDDEEVMKEYGEAIVFYTWDRQPLDVFMKLANADNTNIMNMLNIIRTLILDENKQEIIKDDAMLPTSILMKAITKVTDLLGK